MAEEENKTTWFDPTKLTIETSGAHRCLKCADSFQNNETIYLCAACLTLLHVKCNSRNDLTCANSDCVNTEPLIRVTTQQKELLLSQQILHLLQKDQNTPGNIERPQDETVAEVRKILEDNLHNTEEYVIVQRFYEESGTIDPKKVELMGVYKSKREALQNVNLQQAEVIWTRGTFLTMYGKKAQELLKAYDADVKRPETKSPETKDSEQS